MRLNGSATQPESVRNEPDNDDGEQKIDDQTRDYARRIGRAIRHPAKCLEPEKRFPSAFSLRDWEAEHFRMACRAAWKSIAYAKRANEINQHLQGIGRIAANFATCAIPIRPLRHSLVRLASIMLISINRDESDRVPMPGIRHRRALE